LNIMTDNKNFEICVICHKETNIPVNLHIAQRAHYIEGAGQLCAKCYAKINKKPKKKNDYGV